MQPNMSDHTVMFLQSLQEIIARFDPGCFDRMMDVLTDVRDNGGRIFFLGVGGSAANASHAVNDFRKIAEIESYSPSDNVSELTARTNDDGWESSYANWLRVSRYGGYTAQVADACLIIPTMFEDMVTPLAETVQAVVWHLLVSHPRLRLHKAKWESVPAFT
jgi:D-sedoheptulose 7-phosphate isomerase